jgi:holin-like protein
LLLAQGCLGLSVLVGIFLFSQFVIRQFNLSFPPALMGIGILFLGLILVRRVPKPLALGARPILQHMVVFFIPAIVGIVSYVDLIIAFPLALVLSIVVSTVVSLFITSWLSAKLLKGQQ